MNPHLHFFNGTDPAPSEGGNSDDGATVTGCAQPRSPLAEGENYSQHETDWRFGFCHARRLTSREKASGRQYAGVLHDLHRRFRFDRMVMDPNGGGTNVKREMIAPVQLIHGVETAVRPIADQVDGPKLVTDADFILHMWKRGDPGIELLWPDAHAELVGSFGEVKSRFVKDDVLNQTLYAQFKDGLDGGVIEMPPAFIAREQYYNWPEERQYAQTNLLALVSQAVGVFVKMNPDGETYALTKQNAKQFDSTGKKDLVSAAMYAYAAFLIWLKSGEFEGDGMEEEETMRGWETSQ